LNEFPGKHNTPLSAVTIVSTVGSTNTISATPVYSAQDGEITTKLSSL
jgi:hypothetical protein